jgi:pyruvate kinase
MEFIGSMRKTKIVATLGPATSTPVMIAALIDAGANIFRLNMSHAPHDWVRSVVQVIRAASAERRLHIGIMMDTQGPAIRTGDLSVPLDLKPARNSRSRSAANAARRSIPWMSITPISSMTSTWATRCCSITVRSR